MFPFVFFLYYYSIVNVFILDILIFFLIISFRLIMVVVNFGLVAIKKGEKITEGRILM
jgi:hypothetical protein